MATISGTSSDDSLFVPAGESNDTLLGLDGNDYLDATTGAGGNILRGGNGNDQLYAYINDQLYGDAGDDTLNSDGNGFNFLYGGDGNDTIFADRNDSVYGDAGNDRIFAGFGSSKLTGGSGLDVFYLTPSGVPAGASEVEDFTEAQDTVVITAVSGVQSFDNIIRVQSGADTILKANVGGTAQELGTLKNIQADTLTASDFNFGSTPINHRPDADPDKTITLLEDAAATPLGIAVPTDVDGDPLTLVVNTIPDAVKGQVRLSDGTAVTAGSALTLNQLTSLVFVPVANANGSAGTFSYTVSDGKGGSDSQIVTFDVTPDKTGSSVGDPHITTFDGFHYDFQSKGDFVLVQGLDSDLVVQIRQTPWEQNLATTLNTGLATLVDGNRVELYSSQPGLLINGLALNLEIGQSMALGKGSISHSAIAESGYGVSGDLYSVTYANGDILDSEVYRDFLINPTLDLAGSHSVSGLLGNNNGNTDDDLALRSGELLTGSFAPENLDGKFAESWRVSDSESLFSIALTIQMRAELTDTSIAAVQDRIVLQDILGGLPTKDTTQLQGSVYEYTLGAAPTGLADGIGSFLTNNSSELASVIQGTNTALTLPNSSQPLIF